MATKKKKKRGKNYKKLLTDLLEYSVGNRGSREGNPYLKKEVYAAAKALGTIDY
jgi:hypothetical protein